MAEEFIEDCEESTNSKYRQNKFSTIRSTYIFPVEIQKTSKLSEEEINRIYGKVLHYFNFSNW